MCCIICDQDEARNINMYVIGSEGLNLCVDCEMLVINYIRQLISVAGRSRMRGYRACADNRDKKEANANN